MLSSGMLCYAVLCYAMLYHGLSRSHACECRVQCDQADSILHGLIIQTRYVNQMSTALQQGICTVEWGKSEIGDTFVKVACGGGAQERSDRLDKGLWL